MPHSTIWKREGAVAARLAEVAARLAEVAARLAEVAAVVDHPQVVHLVQAPGPQGKSGVCCLLPTPVANIYFQFVRRSWQRWYRRRTELWRRQILRRRFNIRIFRRLSLATRCGAILARRRSPRFLSRLMALRRVRIPVQSSIQLPQSNGGKLNEP